MKAISIFGKKRAIKNKKPKKKYVEEEKNSFE